MYVCMYVCMYVYMYVFVVRNHRFYFIERIATSRHCNLLMTIDCLKITVSLIKFHTPIISIQFNNSYISIPQCHSIDFPFH